MLRGRPSRSQRRARPCSPWGSRPIGSPRKKPRPDLDRLWRDLRRRVAGPARGAGTLCPCRNG
ncbi:hypothetical protein GJ668_12010 [Allochromatium palmeri]|uniref:Menbrane protein HflK N-terminal domain-containing protein n=1 Tax=Allochromatium palmeri TaxID=231048 RepID=A0A6N8EC68_9GAMM|nr:hypothetical protein [Allochromatium palmeri]